MKYVNIFLKVLPYVLLVSLGTPLIWAGVELSIHGQFEMQASDMVLCIILSVSFLLNIFFICSCIRGYQEMKRFNAQVTEAVQMNAECHNYPKDTFEYHQTLSTILQGCKSLDILVTETIKNENGQESSVVKFENVEQFAKQVKMMNDLIIDFINKA